MNFDDAQQVEQICWQLKLGDYPRSLNRSRINNMANGVPPYDDEEARENHLDVNVNPLSHTRLMHDARSQFYGAYMKPGNFFTARTDWGPQHKKKEYGTIVTSSVNRIMKRSPVYFETMRSKFALNVLHGIGPCAWEDRDHWCPDPVGVEDVLIPAGTLLTMKNLPFFAIHRSYSAPELIKMTRGEKAEKAGWNMNLVKECLDFIDKECTALLGSTWAEVWSPEKISERQKGDGGWYASDKAPSIEVFDFYFWNDEGKKCGWNRRMILDAWGSPGAGPDGGAVLARKTDTGKGQFLFNPGKRKYADKICELINFQFADLSAVAPFQYHSVRSLGFLVWAVCHLQARLYCRIQEATFESLLQYFRVNSPDDAERALKIELVNRGLIDQSVQMIPAAERWQTNVQLAEFGYEKNQQIITENSSAYVQNQNFSRDRTEKTKFQVMAEVNAMTTLISSGLAQAYQYQTFEYIEDFRRFMRSNSRDPDVREFRKNCLITGVPERLLTPEAWEIEPERIMGAGNKTLEMTIAQQLMEWRNLYDPGAQRKILRDVTLAITDDAARAEELVPEQPQVSNATEDAQRAAAALLMGLPVAFKEGVAHTEYIEALLVAMGSEVQRIESFQNGVATQDQLLGLQTIAGQDLNGQPTSQNGVVQHIALLAQDENEGERVKQYGDVLGRLMNRVKAFAQRLMEQQQQQNGEAQMDPKDIARIQGMQLQAQAKAANTRESHAERTSQKQVSFEMEQARKQEQHAMDMQQQMSEQQIKIAAEAVKTQAEIARENAKADNEPKTTAE